MLYKNAFDPSVFSFDTGGHPARCVSLPLFRLAGSALHFYVRLWHASFRLLSHRVLLTPTIPAHSVALAAATKNIKVLRVRGFSMNLSRGEETQQTARQGSPGTTEQNLSRSMQRWAGPGGEKL